MPRTLATVATFLRDPARRASIPESSHTGLKGEAWLPRHRRVDDLGLPCGTLLHLGGAAHRADVLASGFSQGLTEDEVVLRRIPYPFRLPKDDFEVVVERSEGFPLTVHVACLEGMDGAPNPALRILRIGVNRLEDGAAARLVRHALECRYAGMGPRDLVLAVRDEAVAMGCERSMLGWFAKGRSPAPPSVDEVDSTSPGPR